MSSDSDVPAIMVPFMIELVPSVTVLAAIQNTLLALAPLVNTTLLVAAVVIDDSLRMMKTDDPSPSASRYSEPPGEISSDDPDS